MNQPGSSTAWEEYGEWLERNVVFVQCSGCDGSGEITEACWTFEREFGCSIPDVIAHPCPYCDGTGHEETQGEPITLDDLDNL